MSISYQLRIFSYYLHCLLQEAVNNTVFFAFPDDSSLTFAYLRADQESLTVYTSKPSQWTRDSVCRDSDAGYFASRSGVAGVVSTSEDEAGDDPPGDQGDPPDDETDPTTDTDIDEELPKSDDDTVSPEATVQPDENPHTKREPVGQSMNMAAGATALKQGTCAADVHLQGRLGREQLSTSSQETESKKGGAKKASPPVADEQPDPKTLPSKDDPCGSVGITDKKEPTVSHEQGVEGTQDVVGVEDECAPIIVEGQQLQMVMAHMEPHDYHRPPPPHPRGERHLRAVPFPIQESEQGREKPAQLALPHT